MRLPASIDMAPGGPEDRTAKVLTAAGAYFSPRRGVFVFADLFPPGSARSARTVIDAIIAGGHTAPRPYQGEAPCPPAIAERMCDELGLQRGERVLEPSAGHGNLAAEAAHRGCAVDCVEREHRRAVVIKTAGFARHVVTADFLTLPQRPLYDAVVMFPPFRRDLAAAHIVHAVGFLRPGGRLGVLVAPYLQTGTLKATVALNELLQEYPAERHDVTGEIMSPQGKPLKAELWIIDVWHR